MHVIKAISASAWIRRPPIVSVRNAPSEFGALHGEAKVPSEFDLRGPNLGFRSDGPIRCLGAKIHYGFRLGAGGGVRIHRESLRQRPQCVE